MDIQFKSKMTREIKLSFWDYLLDHACICNESMCMCKASTFQDTVANLRIFNDDSRLQEILDRN